ncbi:MAG TPA: serpin family protein [Longimicrobium sp.]|nr:serpin family protein [Longimicrobium sp.]
MHRRSFRPLLAVTGLLTLTAACAKAQDKPKVDVRGVKPLDTTPWVPGPAEVARRDQAAPDYAAFGLDLFRRLADARPNENVIVSPLSAGLAVSMVANGATGATRAGIEQALATGMGVDALNPANASLAAALRTEDVELAVANSLWARQGVPFLPAFLQQNREFYQAEVATLDFDSPEAPRRINEWASRNTRGRITEMVKGPLDGDLIMYLMNAVYFKGRWQDEFRPAATRPRTFHAPGGGVQRPMMSRTGSYGYLQADGMQGVRLPYRGGRFAMYVLLPDAGRPLAQFRAGLTADAWRGWVGRFQPREVRLVMPRYRMSLESRLNEPLQAMGMADAFSPQRARLGAMLPAEFLARQNAYVGEAKQKVFIEVNEEGTEAAAVTGVEIRTTSAPPPPTEVVVDRPFVLVIRDDTTGALLFVGQVNDPVTQ